MRRAMKRKVRNKNVAEGKKKLVERLDHMGQTKYEYNITERNRKKIENEAKEFREGKGKDLGDAKFTKSSKFFDTIQGLKKRPAKADMIVEDSKAKQNKLKKLKL